MVGLIESRLVGLSPSRDARHLSECRPRASRSLSKRGLQHPRTRLEKREVARRAIGIEWAASLLSVSLHAHVHYPEPHISKQSRAMQSPILSYAPRHTVICPQTHSIGCSVIEVPRALCSNSCLLVLAWFLVERALVLASSVYIPALLYVG